VQLRYLQYLSLILIWLPGIYPLTIPSPCIEMGTNEGGGAPLLLVLKHRLMKVERGLKSLGVELGIRRQEDFPSCCVICELYD